MSISEANHSPTYSSAAAVAPSVASSDAAVNDDGVIVVGENEAIGGGDGGDGSDGRTYERRIKRGNRPWDNVVSSSSSSSPTASKGSRYRGAGTRAGGGTAGAGTSAGTGVSTGELRDLPRVTMSDGGLGGIVAAAAGGGGGGGMSTAATAGPDCGDADSVSILSELEAARFALSSFTAVGVGGVGEEASSPPSASQSQQQRRVYEADAASRPNRAGRFQAGNAPSAMSDFRSNGWDDVVPGATISSNAATQKSPGRTRMGSAGYADALGGAGAAAAWPSSPSENSPSRYRSTQSRAETVMARMQRRRSNDSALPSTPLMDHHHHHHQQQQQQKKNNHRRGRSGDAGHSLVGARPSGGVGGNVGVGVGGSGCVGGGHARAQARANAFKAARRASMDKSNMLAELADGHGRGHGGVSPPHGLRQSLHDHGTGTGTGTSAHVGDGDGDGGSQTRERTASPTFPVSESEWDIAVVRVGCDGGRDKNGDADDAGDVSNTSNRDKGGGSDAPLSREDAVKPTTTTTTTTTKQVPSPPTGEKKDSVFGGGSSSSFSFRSRGIRPASLCLGFSSRSLGLASIGRNKSSLTQSTGTTAASSRSGLVVGDIITEDNGGKYGGGGGGSGGNSDLAMDDEKLKNYDTRDREGEGGKAGAGADGKGGGGGGGNESVDVDGYASNADNTFTPGDKHGGFGDFGDFVDDDSQPQQQQQQQQQQHLQQRQERQTNPADDDPFQIAGGDAFANSVLKTSRAESGGRKGGNATFMSSLFRSSAGDDGNDNGGNKVSSPTLFDDDTLTSASFPPAMDEASTKDAVKGGDEIPKEAANDGEDAKSPSKAETEPSIADAAVSQRAMTMLSAYEEAFLDMDESGADEGGGSSGEGGSAIGGLKGGGGIGGQMTRRRESSGDSLVSQRTGGSKSHDGSEDGAAPGGDGSRHSERSGGSRRLLAPRRRNSNSSMRSAHSAESNSRERTSHLLSAYEKSSFADMDSDDEYEKEGGSGSSSAAASASPSASTATATAAVPVTRAGGMLFAARQASFASRNTSVTAVAAAAAAVTTAPHKKGILKKSAPPPLDVSADDASVGSNRSGRTSRSLGSQPYRRTANAAPSMGGDGRGSSRGGGGGGAAAGAEGRARGAAGPMARDQSGAQPARRRGKSLTRDAERQMGMSGAGNPPLKLVARRVSSTPADDDDAMSHRSSQSCQTATRRPVSTGRAGIEPTGRGGSGGKRVGAPRQQRPVDGRGAGGGGGVNNNDGEPTGPSERRRAEGQLRSPQKHTGHPSHGRAGSTDQRRPRLRPSGGQSPSAQGSPPHSQQAAGENPSPGMEPGQRPLGQRPAVSNIPQRRNPTGAAGAPGRSPSGRGPSGRGPPGRGPPGRGPPARGPPGRGPSGRGPPGRGGAPGRGSPGRGSPGRGPQGGGGPPGRHVQAAPPGQRPGGGGPPGRHVQAGPPGQRPDGGGGGPRRPPAQRPQPCVGSPPQRRPAPPSQESRGAEPQDGHNRGPPTASPLSPGHRDPNVEPLEEDMLSEEGDSGRKVFHGEMYSAGRRSHGSVVLDDPFALLPGSNDSTSQFSQSSGTGEDRM